jgi:succinoglycan biosynthesis protein ExoA
VAQAVAEDARVRLIDNPGGQISRGLNRAIAAARGEIIVRVDARTRLTPDYVRQCVSWLAQTGAGNVGGHMRAVGEGWWGRAVAAAHHSRFGLGGGRFHDPAASGDVDTVYLGAFPREALEAVGGYDERLDRNQDIELNRRLRAQGRRVYLTPEIRSEYLCRSSLWSFCRRMFETGRWNLATIQITPGALSLRHFAPGAFVLALIAAGAAAFFSPVGLIALAVLVGAYVAAALVASDAAARRAGPALLVSLPIVFAGLHISYGLGTICGAIAPPHRRRRS